jgi:hypothetical protein
MLGVNSRQLSNASYGPMSTRNRSRIDSLRGLSRGIGASDYDQQLYAARRLEQPKVFQVAINGRTGHAGAKN